MKPLTFEEQQVTHRPRPTPYQESLYLERKQRMIDFWSSTRLKGVRFMA